MAKVTLEQALKLAVEHHQAGRLAPAEILYRKILEHQPQNTDALHLLGLVEYRAGHLDAALKLLSRAAELAPTIPDYQNNLGNALRDAGRSTEAVAAYQTALRLKPNYPEAWNNLGTALQDQKLLNQAVHAYRRALELNANLPDIYSNLGNALHSMGRLDEAIECYNRTIARDPNFAPVYNNLGNALSDQGKLNEAIEAFRKATQILPDFQRAHSHLLYTLQFLPDMTGPEMLKEHRAWAERFAEPLTKEAKPHPNSRIADRKLRIGYVSPDFREHAVGRFMLPLLEMHDRTHFEIICYSDVFAPDELTTRIKRSSNAWHSLVGLHDQQAADLIRSHEVDILVDLSVHSGINRLRMFARRPAAVQLTWLGYPGTTGMSAIDWRLTDVYLDPEDQNDDAYAEPSWRLPATYWCYQPHPTTPEVSALPAIASKHVTFGCLNSLRKVSPASISTWSKILLAVPDSRLVLFVYEGSHRADLIKQFTAASVSADRLEFVTRQSFTEYLETYGRIDIALDPFPYNGGTTTCDALWMGVPVVTLAGKLAVSRAGVSILTNANLARTIAQTPDDYVKIASTLGANIDKLASMRANMRAHLAKSRLCNAPQFTRDMEEAYRQIWTRWCQKSA